MLIGHGMNDGPYNRRIADLERENSLYGLGATFKIGSLSSVQVCYLRREDIADDASIFIVVACGRCISLAC
jgi:hypothetical protein